MVDPAAVSRGTSNEERGGSLLSASVLLGPATLVVALGLLARLMPTLQVFFIAMPMQLLAGLALMAVALTSMMLYFLSSYEERISSRTSRIVSRVFSMDSCQSS